MKQIKSFLIFVFGLSLILTSCRLSNENSTKFKDNPRLELITLDNGKEILLRKDYYGTYSFNNWNSYNLINTELHKLEELDFKISKNRCLNVKDEISSLSTTIPNWLKRKQVVEDIDSLQIKYSILLKERNKSTTILRNNWVELVEKFDDLRDDLSKTVKEYST